MSNNRVAWLSSDDPPSAFPRIQSALREPNGLLAAGGDLSSDRLLHAYRNGIFPWYEEGQPILWWSPDPRCVLCPADYHVSSRLSRELPRSTATLTVNESFDEVICACAGPRRSEQGTWITRDMLDAYSVLHAEGWAHSIEVRQGEALVGGLYGLAIGKAFFGESMFSHKSDASKLALLGLTGILIDNDFSLLDCQVVSSHLLTLGATILPRSEFAAVLGIACDRPDRFENWPDTPINIRDLRLNQR